MTIQKKKGCLNKCLEYKLEAELRIFLKGVPFLKG